MARNPTLADLSDEDRADRLEVIPPPTALTGKPVDYRVMKLGADKIFTGEYDRETLEHTKHPRNAIVRGIDETIALSLEDRGWVEIGDYPEEQPADA